MHIKDALRPILSANYRNLLRDSILATNQCESKQKLVIDFSSPNIAKPFHFGHLKSTLLGNYLANINEFLGNQVTRLNYIGDWGTQYGLLSLGLDKFESDLSSASPNQRLRRLLDIYVQANELGKSDETFYAEARRRFKALGEDRDSKHYKKWREIRDLSLEELKRSYDAIGIKFDEFEFESDYAGDLNPMIKQLEERGVAQRLADGLVSARVERNGRFLDIPVLKADGTSLYITRDIAAAVRRKERYNFDKMLYVVGCDQEKHFYCLGNLVKSLGYDWHDQLIHVKMGKILGMSSRQGTSILLSDIIREATQRYMERTKNTPTSKVDASRRDELEDVGKNLALSALFIHDMRNTRTKNYSFDWDRVMNVTNRSGIDLQTTYARLCSLLDRNRSFGNEPYNHVDELRPDAVDCIEATSLLEHLGELVKVIGSSHQSMDPSPLVNHAFVLCKAINRARRSEKLWVMGESDKEFARTRLTMFMAARIQLALIMELLGLKPLSKV